MKTRILTVSLAAILAAGPSFAQSTVTTATPQQQAKHAGLMGALKGGGIGCLAGGLLGALTHHNTLKSCAIGGAAGAVIGGVRAYKHTLADAQSLADQANRSGVQATVSTRTIETKDAAGQPTQTQALDRMTLALDAQDVAAHAPGTSDVLIKAAHLADESTDPVTLTVSGTRSQRTWVADTLRDNLRSGTTAQVVEQSAASPSVVISPVPRVAQAGSLDRNDVSCGAGTCGEKITTTWIGTTAKKPSR